MSNPLFNLLGGMTAPPAVPNIWGQFQSFARSIQGNPQTIVQNLISSGRMSQEQFNRFGQMANNILKK